MGNAKKEASRRERKGQTKGFSKVKVKVRISHRNEARADDLREKISIEMQRK
jgi:hypothetical protein